MKWAAGFEPATSSLGIQTYVGSKSLARFCCDFLNLQHLAESAFSKLASSNEARTRHVPPPVWCLPWYSHCQPLTAPWPRIRALSARGIIDQQQKPLNRPVAQFAVNVMSLPSSTRTLIRRIEALESTSRRAAPRKRNLLLEMSITAMALAWTPDEVEAILTAAERSNLDDLPPDLARRWVRFLDCISKQSFGKSFGALLAFQAVKTEPSSSSRDADPA